MDILYVFILAALVILGMIAGAVFLLRQGAKTEKKALRVIGIIMCVIAGLGLLGLGFFIWLLSLNASPYS
ncbi:MAG: hypothetical protein LBD23_11995 [Oscillospiraceae bacterium]|jgi:hypothetical protein|nr:hypothetical protein [Oscillospiraceae bacterium]